MRRNILIMFILGLMGFSQLNYAQDRESIEQELNRIRNTIDRITAFVNVLPNNDIKQLIIGDLEKANEEYRKAVEFANNHRYGLARVHIRLAYQYLKKIQNLFKSHPIFKIKFRERLDVRIQRAEKIVQTHQDPEALHMLNRAKFFKQKAYLAFRSDHSFNALEYYRIALFFADKAIQMSNAEADRSQKDWPNLLSETEMLLTKVRQLVENSQNNQLRNLFEKANQEMQEVERLYASKRIESAKRKLLILHRSLYRMIDLAENVPSIENDRLKVDLEALKYSTQSLREDIKDIDAPVVNQLYFRVSNLVQNIENDLNQGNVALARQKILVANRLIVKIYRLVESKSINSRDEIRVQIERTKQSFEDLQNTVRDESIPSELLLLIEKNINKAGKAVDENRYLSAAFHIKMANKLILKANRLRLVQALENDQEDQIKSDLQRLQNLINRIDSDKNDDEDFLIRYENAKRLSEMAEKSFSEGNLQVCKELTTTAINLITQE